MLTVISGFAIIMLPRQFYVTIVENRSEIELRTASWVFPLYLVAINLFVLPIAFAGVLMVGPQTSSDLYVLSLPLLRYFDEQFLKSNVPIYQPTSEEPNAFSSIWLRRVV